MDGAAFGDRDLDRVEQRAALAARVPVAEVQRSASSAAHHEADAVADVVVEAEAVGTTDQLHAVTADDVEELRLALAKAAFGLGRIVAVQVRRVCSRPTRCGSRVAARELSDALPSSDSELVPA